MSKAKLTAVDQRPQIIEAIEKYLVERFEPKDAIVTVKLIDHTYADLMVHYLPLNCFGAIKIYLVDYQRLADEDRLLALEHWGDQLAQRLGENCF